MNYNLNDLIDETMIRFYETFHLTLDTCEYVPELTNKMVVRYLNKAFKKKFKEAFSEDANFQRQRKLIKKFKKETKEKLKKEYARHGEKSETLPVQIGSTETCDSGELCEAECPAETAGATSSTAE